MTAWLVAFCTMFALDYIWAKYTKAITYHRASGAAHFAAGITLCNAIVTVGYVNNFWLLIPTLAGAWCGTYYGVKKQPA